MNYLEYLKGGDFRSLAGSRLLIKYIKSQAEFDELFTMLSHTDDLIRMRASDVIEKVTAINRDYLKSHKKEIIALSSRKTRKEIKWHYALLLARLSLTRNETGKVWKTLSDWVCDRNESRIVRVNSLQAMYELAVRYPELNSDLDLIFLALDRENIPSLNARTRKLKALRKAIQKV